MTPEEILQLRQDLTEWDALQDGPDWLLDNFMNLADGRTQRWAEAIRTIVAPTIQDPQAAVERAAIRFEEDEDNTHLMACLYHDGDQARPALLVGHGRGELRRIPGHVMYRLPDWVWYVAWLS